MGLNGYLYVFTFVQFSQSKNYYKDSVAKKKVEKLRMYQDKQKSISKDSRAKKAYLELS